MTLAAGTIFLAGLFTFASPCVMPLIPIYLSVLLGGSLEGVEGDRRGRLRLLANGFMFVLGFAMVFVALGLATTAAGRFFLRHRALFEQVGGMLVFLFGLKFLGWLKIEALDREKRFQLAAKPGMSPFGALLMGLTFAFGWTPCIGPVLGAVLTFTAVATDSPAVGAGYLGLYALGIGLPLLAVAVLAQTGVRLLNKVKRHIPKFEKATGVALVAMALLMVTGHTSVLMFGIGDDASAAISKDVVAETRPTSALATAAPRNDGATPSGETATCSEEAGCGLGGEPVFAAGGPVTIPPGPVLVDFYKPDCPACLTMVPILRALEDTCGAAGMKVAKVDASTAAGRALAVEMGVVGTPTLVFLDAEAREVSRLVGATDADTLHQAVAVLMGEKCAQFTRL